MHRQVSNVTLSPAQRARNLINNDQFYRPSIIVASLLYGVVLASLPLYIFLDRLNYQNYFKYGDILLRLRLQSGWLSFLSNEPIWLILTKYMGEVFGVDNSMRLLIGVPAALVAYSVLRLGPSNVVWLFVYLFFPLVIKNHIVHLRQGLAISIFILAYLVVRNSKVKILLFAITPFIHSSFFFILLLMIGSRWIEKTRRNVLAVTFAEFFICLIISVFLPYILSLSKARQLEGAAPHTVSVSGLGFVFWAVILIFLLWSGGETVRECSFAVVLLVFYLCTYFTFEQAGRVFESGVLIVLLSLLKVPAEKRLWVLTLIFVFFLLNWAVRFSNPGLGWIAQ